MESPQKINEIYHLFILSLWNHVFYNTSQLGPATFQVLSRLAWLVATLLDNMASRFPRNFSSELRLISFDLSMLIDFKHGS